MTLHDNPTPNQKNGSESEGHSDAETFDLPRGPELMEGRMPEDGDLEGEWRYPDEVLGRVEVKLRTFQKCSTGQAFNSLMDLLNGGLGDMNGLYHDDDDNQQGKVDLEALQLLYGVMRFTGEDPREAAKLAYIAYWHYCHEDDNQRNFADWPEGYRIDRLKRAISGFDWGGWYRWRRWKHEDGLDDEDPHNWTNDYGEPCYKIALALVDIGCGELTPEEAVRYYEVDLPTGSDTIIELANGEQCEELGTPPILGNDRINSTKYTLSSPKIRGVGDSTSYADSPSQRWVQMRDVVSAATEIDSRSRRTYKTVIQNLRKDGYLKWAEIKQGVDYRIYPAHFPDPPDANRVKFKSEEYEPEQPGSDESEKEVMTDGGVDMVETDDVPVLPCPLCGSAFIEHGALKAHVIQSRDADHRHHELDETLEPVKRWDSVDWGPGPPP